MEEEELENLDGNRLELIELENTIYASDYSKGNRKILKN